jgi:hypothetical protein
MRILLQQLCFVCVAAIALRDDNIDKVLAPPTIQIAPGMSGFILRQRAKL